MLLFGLWNSLQILVTCQPTQMTQIIKSNSIPQTKPPEHIFGTEKHVWSNQASACTNNLGDACISTKKTGAGVLRFWCSDPPLPSQATSQMKTSSSLICHWLKLSLMLSLTKKWRSTSMQKSCRPPPSAACFTNLNQHRWFMITHKHRAFRRYLQQRNHKWGAKVNWSWSGWVLAAALTLSTAAPMIILHKNLCCSCPNAAVWCCFSPMLMPITWCRLHERHCYCAARFTLPPLQLHYSSIIIVGLCSCESKVVTHCSSDSLQLWLTTAVTHPS